MIKIEVNEWRCSLCKKKISSADKPNNCSTCGKGRVRIKMRFRPRGKGKNRKYYPKIAKKYLIKPHFDKVAGKAWAYK